MQNIYVRKVEKKDGALYNVEFETIPNVKDPYKAAKREADRRPTLVAGVLMRGDAEAREPAKPSSSRIPASPRPKQGRGGGFAKFGSRLAGCGQTYD